MIQQEKCQFQLSRVCDLTDNDWTLWKEFQNLNDSLDSPFFHPELTRCVSKIRDDVEVVILKQHGAAVGYFPFQRCSGNIAQAVVGRLSEFHGVIAKPQVQFDPEELIRAAGLNAWHFDHLPNSQHQFEDYIWGDSGSPYIDVTRGYDEYRNAIKSRGSSISQVERKRRKLEREVGKLRFEFHTDDESAFSHLFDWKTTQHERTGVLQVLKVDWVVELLNLLRNSQFGDLKGQFSTLYAGDQLLAVHLGLRTDRSLHLWFPAYNVEFEKYSPGLIILLEMIKSSAEQKLNRVHLGRGEERYKVNFKTDDLPIGEGAVDLRVLSPQVRRSWFNTKRWIRQSPYRRQLELPLKASKKLRQWLAFK